MQASNAPSKSAVPFAESGTKNTIPVESQIGVTPGAASFTDGFPPLTMTPLAAGGVPPYGADFNGIFNFLSAAVRWAQAGGRYPFDAAFAADVGGYPKGAVLAAASGNGSWLNLIDNNSTNPDTGGANWISLGSGIATTAQAQALTDDAALVTPKKLADAFKGTSWNPSSPGYVRLPNGIIIQWGAASGFNSYTISFPIAFPAGPLMAPLAVCIGGEDYDAPNAAWAEASNFPTKTTGKIFVYKPGPTGGAVSAARAICWICIGI
ncbi:MAG TPA: hypothetical protein VEA17_21965 [Bordetella sp.]|nr:hypothetical protein [Bordetella sp.]